MVRSAGGWSEVLSLRQRGQKQFSDERILGSGEFVKDILDINKGGTWAGATEQLDKLRLVPVYVRSTGVSSRGLDALRSKGALPWPEPHSADAFDAVFENSLSPIPEKKQDSIGLFLDD